MIRLCSRRSRELFVALAIGLSVPASAIAADIRIPTKAAVVPPPAIDAWTFRLTPYAWAVSLSGSTTIKDNTTDVDASFFDILRHTQFPKGLFEAAAFGEARYGRFALLTDIAYMKLGVGASESRSVDTSNVGVSAELTVQMVIAEVAAAYEVAHWGATMSPGSGTALDLYGGGRFWWQHADALLTVSGAVVGTISKEGTKQWIDPVVGIRLRHQFVPGLNLVVSGDVGGFDVGSRLSWQAIAALDYDFMKTNSAIWSGMVGYKALFVDYSTGSGLARYEYDMTMYGPIFGVTARW
jgi:hypothetical protein